MDVTPDEVVARPAPRGRHDDGARPHPSAGHARAAKWTASRRGASCSATGTRRAACWSGATTAWSCARCARKVATSRPSGPILPLSSPLPRPACPSGSGTRDPARRPARPRPRRAARSRSRGALAPLLGQPQVQPGVPRLRGRQRRVERPQRLAEQRDQPDETLVRARLDQGAGQQQVDAALGFRRGAAPCAGPRRSATGSAAGTAPASAELLLHQLEMPQLLARQPRHAVGQLEVLGVREHQRQRGRRRLLLAIGVIEQQVLPALGRQREPARIGA